MYQRFMSHGAKADAPPRSTEFFWVETGVFFCFHTHLREYKAFGSTPQSQF
jgi:hypothetical protein